MLRIIAVVWGLAFTFVAQTAYAQETTNRKATLRWTAPTACEDGSSLVQCPVLGYSIQKNIDDNWTQIGVTTADVLTYVDENLPLGVHTYRVLATSEAGPSLPSNEGSKSFNVPGAPGNLIITVTITVSQ